ncbi:MAG: peptidoglycan-binding protein [Acidobacteria bacterium]|nr:peptidoglycan-binding protein [Acidobacteriota bacterium]
MTKLLSALLALVLALSAASLSAQNNNANTPTSPSAETTKKKRGPVFRATKEQIKQAQTILKQRGFYAGNESGKLDTDTRAGLRKYQEAEGIKVTGTLNRMTLEKMNITLTDKQKAMPT